METIDWERQWLAPIGLLAFEEVFESDPREGVEEPFNLDRGDPAVTGAQWAEGVTRAASVGFVLSTATRWKFGETIADAMELLFRDIVDPDCILDVIPALIDADNSDELRDAAIDRFVEAMARPVPVPEPIPRLRKAFRAAQHAVSAEEGPSRQDDPAPPLSVSPAIYQDALDGWILGTRVGYRLGLQEALAKTIESRFGEQVRAQASELLHECGDPVKAGMLSAMMLDVTSPAGVYYWCREIASMGPEELKDVVSPESIARDLVVALRWPPLSSLN